MTGLELNLFGLVLIVCQFAVHLYTYIKTYILCTMHPNEGARIDRIAFVGGLVAFGSAMLAYGVTY